jgi:hypothetical protein
VASRIWIVVFALAPLCAGCNGDDASADSDDAGRARCLDPLPLDCEPTYPPTFEALHQHQLARTCGAASTGGSCHGPDGAQGGLVLSGIDESYDALLGAIDGRARVIPGDPECSTLIQRLESDDPEFVMPVGARLTEGERCAVRQWIAMGAER